MLRMQRPLANQNTHTPTASMQEIEEKNTKMYAQHKNYEQHSSYEIKTRHRMSKTPLKAFNVFFLKKKSKSEGPIISPQNSYPSNEL